MNRTLTPLVFAFGTSSLLLMDSAIKGSVILLGAACLAAMLKRDSAAMRHLVWLVAIVAMLVIPVFSVLLPRWQVLPAWATISQRSPAIEIPTRAVELPKTFEAPTAESPEQFIPGEFGSQSKAIDTSVNSRTQAQPRLEATQNDVRVDRAPSDLSWSWMSGLPFLWSIGFGVLLLRLMAARWILWSNEQRATVIAVLGCINNARKPIQHESDAAIAAAFENAHRQLGVRHRVQLLIDSERTIPVVWGIVRFRLMLPDSARQWSSEQLRSVLLHELAHIKRRDTIVQLLAQTACALHWFNPLVWFAAWRLHVERERACDDIVLAQGVRASAYAEHLLNVATKLSVARWTSACGLAMASRSPLESRLHAILSDRLNRRKVSTAIGMIGLLLGAGIAIPIAMLHAADEKWNPPQGAHIGTNDFSAYCVHDGKDAAFLIAYPGFTGSSSAHDSNPKTRTWTDSGTITAKKPGIALSFHRTHTAPGKLSITTTPAEGRDLSKPAPPPRKFGQREYDLTKGRVFLLSDNGAVRQLDIATPVVTDQASAIKLAALIAAISPQEREDVALTTNLTGKLAPETIAKLKWGEPVNGLRMALAYPPALGDSLLGQKPHFELVVQNVAEKEIHFLASDEAPNPRRMLIREGERIVQGLRDHLEVSPADWNLLPGECGVLRLFATEESDKAGTVPSSAIESVLSKPSLYHAIAEMEVVKAPKGTWTGKLVTGQTRGSADLAAAPAPMHKDARAYYEVWQRYARSNGGIPGALVGELAAAVRQFIKYNPTWETVPKLNELLPRLYVTHDWKPADAIALLDEVADIQNTLLEQAPWKGTRQTIRQGDTLPKKYADVTWGEEQPSGLRAAWILEPSAAEHRIGTTLKARLLVQNRGQVPVMLQVPTFHQGWVKGTDAKGSEVQVSGISWTTMALLNTVRLGPGAVIEINTPGIGLGPRAGMDPWAGPRVGSNVLAKPGDELTLTHGLVPLDGSEVGVSEDDPHVSGPGWWLAHIKTRLNRELPLPTDVAERTRLLDRAVRELFATAPSAEETAAFVVDKTPDALDALAKRLATRVDAVSFSGKLPTAPAKFRVLAADANGDKQPRVVLGPGEYPLSKGTDESGAATLKIVGRPVGDRRTNDAQILFEATEATGKLTPEPHKLEVPDGWGTWAIVCRPDSDFFYLLNKGTVRKIDYSKPRNVTDTPANDLADEFREEVKRQLEIAGVPAESQAEVFEKPAPPAATPDAAAGKPATKPPGVNIIKVPDAQYVKSGTSADELVGQGIVWNEAQNGLSLGYCIIGDEWRILGKKVKVELWVRNPGDKDVKFQLNMRPDIGVRTQLKGQNGTEQESFTVPNDVPPFCEHRFLPPGHAIKVKEFTVSMLWPENDPSSIKDHIFMVNPGAYEFHCELDLPGISATGEGGKQVTPAEGEWTGTLTTRNLNVTVIAPDAPAPKTAEPSTRADDAMLKPKHESGQSLFRKWQERARTDGKIPGALIGHVAREMDNFLKRYPADEKAPKLAALRPRCDASHDWTQADVVALLDDITAISTAPVSWADLPMEFGEYNTVKPGQPLPAGLNSAAWGEPAANGLRAAWLLEPAPLLVDTGGEAFPTTESIYQHGSVLKARVLFHNAGKAPVVFRTETWHQVDAHTARNAKGAEIKVTSTFFTGITPMAIYRLLPGEYCEVGGHGIAIGAGKYEEEHSTGSVGAVIEAKVGDEVSLSHTVDAAMSIQTTRPDDPKAPAELWKKIVVERVGGEAPVPKEAADRAQLIRRVMLDLLGQLPRPEEVEAFTADSAPDPLEMLVERILAKPHVEPWTGKLPTGATKFRVIAADPNAAKAPRTANSPGRYVLGDAVHLLVSQLSEGDNRTNKAVIAFLSPDPKVASPHKPYEIALPDGIGTYGIVWERGAGVLWILQHDSTRKYVDFTKPDAVKESHFNAGGVFDVPEHMQEAQKKSSGVPVAPVQK